MRATLMYGAGDVRVEQARASGPHRPSTSRGGGGPAGVKHGAFRRAAGGNHGARVVVSPGYSVGDLEEELRDG